MSGEVLTADLPAAYRVEFGSLPLERLEGEKKALGLKPNQLGSKARKDLFVPLRIAALEGDALPFEPAEPAPAQGGSHLR